jgi:DNA adenine methylase
LQDFDYVIKKNAIMTKYADEFQGNLKPFLKWAGGKRWFVHNHAKLLPKRYNRYFEPFLGSGAVYFHLLPEQATLNDSNPDLIETYQALKENWQLVLRYLKVHNKNHCKEYYYHIRSLKPLAKATRAARFIYLNRTCWNGLYRVNLKGEFNVPIGTKDKVLFEEDCFKRISHSLRNAMLISRDFESVIDCAEENDLLFVDPPYTVRHNNNAFVKYNEKLFSWADQERLAVSLEKAQSRGVQIVSTNAYHNSVRLLYKDRFKTKVVSRNSPISSKASTRKNFEELVILTR